jgi:uncharacterized protein
MNQNHSRIKASRSKSQIDYSKVSINAILDEAQVCTVSYVDHGEPRTLPIGYVRIENFLYIHGSVKSHFFRRMQEADLLCITVFILDGLVLAKSGLMHAFNYRSVVLFGKAEPISEDQKKNELLAAFTDRYVPGRWEKIRTTTPQELAATVILEFPIEEASAKIRQGMPNDLEKDKNLPVWSGIVPMKTQILEPIPDENNVPGTLIPEYLKKLQQQ